jgi:hypothetical protein
VPGLPTAMGKENWLVFRIAPCVGNELQPIACFEDPLSAGRSRPIRLNFAHFQSFCAIQWSSIPEFSAACYTLNGILVVY